MFEIKGKVKLITETQQVTDKFKKREFVVTDDSSQYPQDILFQLTQERVDLIGNNKVGDEVKVYFNLRGREWTSPKGEVKYFNTLEAWKIEAGAPASQQFNNIPPAIEMNDGGAEDDLPF